MGILDGSLWAKSAVAVLILALLFHLISFGAPHWAKTNNDFVQRSEHIGLWRYCVNLHGSSGSSCGDFIDYRTSDWLKACQSFMTLGLFGLLASIGVAVVVAFVEDFNEDPKMLTTAICVTAVTTGFLLIGVGVFAGKYNIYFERKDPAYADMANVAELSWAFGLGACSLAFTAASTILIILEMVFNRDN